MFGKITFSNFMMKNELNQKTIWTIGNSTGTLDVFFEMLYSLHIKTLVDIRSYPGSRRYPYFNKETLEISLPENDNQYFHLKELGGRRKVTANSKNMIWRHLAFRGYADYMETDEFKEGIVKLETIALQQPPAYMCSEAFWWSCHRSMVSGYLKVKVWKVMHIMAIGKEEEHPYTAPARIVDGELTYEEEYKE
ncbi:DUF488 domain-containing protein [soil metagenome]